MQQYNYDIKELVISSVAELVCRLHTNTRATVDFPKSYIRAYSITALIRSSI